MKILHIGFILTAPLIVSGCGSGRLTQKADTSANVQGTLDQTPITEKYWKLVTLEGKKVIMAPNQEREIYFMLKTDQHRVGGGGAGYNTFNGTYILEKGQRIRFSALAVHRLFL